MGRDRFTLHPNRGRYLEPMQLSVIVPAYNEEALILATLDSISRSIEQLVESTVEVIVVDNASTDKTYEVCVSNGFKVVRQERPGPAAARNAGARAASGDYLLFIDADVQVSRMAIPIMLATIASEGLVVGGLRAIYEPKKLTSWFICAYWDRKRAQGGPCQGVAQFYESEVFANCGGYDESMWMSEDFDLYVRASRYSSKHGLAPARWVRDALVWPSSRRYDAWSNLRMLLRQGSFMTQHFSRSRRLWKAWRENTVR